MINDVETEAIDSIVVGESSIKPSERFRNLGSRCDAQMHMNVHK